MNKINIGIVAHVDAGKTTVTENLLYLGGVIKEIGRVDNGNTQTDSMELERKRGITIKSSVVSFNWKNVKINILDTPGHADFVAEVERSLSVLDGAVLVVSAVEGVQAHTLMLFRVLKKLKLPTVIFINKLDRSGANYKRVIEEMKKVLSPNIIGIQNAHREGIHELEVEKPYSGDSIEGIIENLCDIDDKFLEAYINGEKIERRYVKQRIQFKARCGKLYPVLIGAALKRIGMQDLMDAVVKYLPYSKGNEASMLSGVVFKIDNSKINNKKTYVRLFNGKINVRDKLSIFGKENDEKVKRIDALLNGKNLESETLRAGDIGILYGIKGVKIGDIIGLRDKKITNINLAQPVLKAKIIPLDEHENIKLYEAILMISEEDPLLKIEASEDQKDIYLNFFGEVQMEVVKAILESNYNIKVKFEKALTIYKETLEKIGTAVTHIFEAENPFYAGIGIKVEPLKRGEGIKYVSEVTTGYLPKTFQNGVEDGVYDALEQGLYGWELTDIKVTLIHGVFDSVMSTPAEFRNLAPMVLMEAINNAKTKLLEPLYEFELKISGEVCGRAILDLTRLRAKFDNPIQLNKDILIQGLIPVNTSRDYNLEVASYTEGKGMFVTKFYGFHEIPFKLGKTRENHKIDPLNKKMYIMYKRNVLKR
ncbi:elongation factor G [Clostridium guangxiense]|uniref:elongation factor G n=1 Tax=Clostridium guangxiense TaxID=1662055 RepID=UPI0022AB3FDB|nr:TetM/TetW/TetO/TetS family tetracycline resistance ribosomal protection protein [Clostridium guangxiense]